MKKLNYLEMSGSPKELGQQLGDFGMTAMHEHLIKTPTWAHLMQWKDHAHVKTMQSLVKNHFPCIWQELQGLAKGLKLPFDKVFIWNARGDLWAHSPDGCSSILQKTPYPRLTHNEDGDPGFLGHCGVIKFRPSKGPEFISFVYPGSIPGHTFAVNEHLLSFTVNNIRALFTQPGVPRMVLCRAAIACEELSQIISLLQTHSRSGAFNLNIADRKRQLCSVEFNNAKVSALHIQRPFFHANHAIHRLMRHYPQQITASSGYRQMQGQAWVSSPLYQSNPLAVLGDRSHKEYPIYRRQSCDTDNENTIATVDFKYQNSGLQWQVYDDPLQTPIYSFNGLTLQT